MNEAPRLIDTPDEKGMSAEFLKLWDSEEKVEKMLELINAHWSVYRDIRPILAKLYQVEIRTSLGSKR